MNETVYFQTPDIKPQYCEAGMISKTDPNYIWYYNEPCKVLISEVKIIPKENVIYDKKSRLYRVKQKPNNMTPKEKAKKLVDKFYDFEYLKLDYEQAKQCALIAVDEILSNDGFSSSIIEWDIFISYWQDVKQEINLL